MIVKKKMIVNLTNTTVCSSDCYNSGISAKKKLKVNDLRCQESN